VTSAWSAKASGLANKIIVTWTDVALQAVCATGTAPSGHLSPVRFREFSNSVDALERLPTEAGDAPRGDGLLAS
jgi:hypothetical protein